MWTWLLSGVALLSLACTAGLSETDIEATVQTRVQEELRKQGLSPGPMFVEITTTPVSTPTVAPTPVVINSRFFNFDVPENMKVVAWWDGRSTKSTETFHVDSDQWAIIWATKPDGGFPGNFIINVYEEGNGFPQMVANVIGDDNDSSVIRGSGDYYLEIISLQNYLIVVLERSG